jgi:hypothetical protein
MNDEEYVSAGRADPYIAGSDDDGDGGFSEVLADAILKRPNSIRGLSSRRAKDKDRDRDRENREAVQHVEFTFPSISDLGNPAARGRSGLAPAAPVNVEAEGRSGDVKEEDWVESCEETPRVEEQSQKAIESLQPPPPVLDEASSADQALAATSDVTP